MAENNRLILVVVEVADLERSAKLYREGFGLELKVENHGGDDRWTSGKHASLSWREASFLHFALYQAKDGSRTSGAQLGFQVDDIQGAHERAVAAGAVVIHPPRPEPWGSTSRYYDFDGNILSLTQGS
jgi:lactoylglutathione lyase